MEGTNVVGSIAYPNSDLNIENFVDRKVIITGYTVGVSGTDTKYLNTLTTSIEFAEQETMPDESQAITVKELNAKLATMNAGDALGELIAVKGYVAANNEGGNFYQLISLVDNTGEANTGIIIKGSDYTEKDLPVGTKVIVSLKYAKYDINNDLPQLRMATIDLPHSGEGNDESPPDHRFAGRRLRWPVCDGKEPHPGGKFDDLGRE